MKLFEKFQGTGVELRSYRSTCFIRTGQHALIPKTFAEDGSEKKVPIRTDLPPSIASVPLPLYETEIKHPPVLKHPQGATNRPET